MWFTRLKRGDNLVPRFLSARRATEGWLYTKQKMALAAGKTMISTPANAFRNSVATSIHY
eukprot:2684435-Amphidinium_carterae.1